MNAFKSNWEANGFKWNFGDKACTDTDFVNDVYKHNVWSMGMNKRSYSSGIWEAIDSFVGALGSEATKEMWNKYTEAGDKVFNASTKVVVKAPVVKIVAKKNRRLQSEKTTEIVADNDGADLTHIKSGVTVPSSLTAAPGQTQFVQSAPLASNLIIATVLLVFASIFIN